MGHVVAGKGQGGIYNSLGALTGMLQIGEDLVRQRRSKPDQPAHAAHQVPASVEQRFSVEAGIECWQITGDREARQPRVTHECLIRRVSCQADLVPGGL